VDPVQYQLSSAARVFKVQALMAAAAAVAWPDLPKPSSPRDDPSAGMPHPGHRPSGYIRSPRATMTAAYSLPLAADGGVIGSTPEVCASFLPSFAWRSDGEVRPHRASPAERLSTRVPDARG
jgi:hypothetical protein